MAAPAGVRLYTKFEFHTVCVVSTQEGQITGMVRSPRGSIDASFLNDPLKPSSLLLRKSVPLLPHAPTVISGPLDMEPSWTCPLAIYPG